MNEQPFSATISEQVTPLAGHGEMAERLRAHPWTETPLGPMQSWPQPLKTLLDLMLAANQPMFIAWGPERTLLYNDPYAKVLVSKHPDALGRDFLDVWDEIRADLVPIVARAYAGEPVHMDHITLVMRRKGYPEETHWAFSYTPVREDSGRVAGFVCACSDITGRITAERSRRAAEDALREGEGRMRGVLDAIAEGFVLLDRDFRVVEINVEGMRLETRPRDEILGRSHWQVWPDTETSELGLLYKKAMAERVPVALEHRYVWPDGRDAWLDVRVYPSGDGLALLYRDISERRRTEEALRQTAERYRLAARATNDAIWDWDLATHAVIWNEAVDAAFGHADAARDGTSAQWWIEHIHPDDRARVDESIHAFIDGTGETWSDEYRFRRADGSYADVFDRGAVLRDEAGRPLRMIGAMQDLSERKRSEAASRASEEQLRLATEAAEVGFWDVDLVTDTLVWPPRVKAMFGISADAAVSMADFYAGLHPDDREATSAAFAAAIDPERRALYDIEYRTIGKEDGVVRWVAAKGQGVFDADGRCVRAIGAAVDITARKRVEARRLALGELGDRIRDIADPDELAFRAAEILGHTLGVSRAGYGTINKADETITIERDWNRPGIKSLAGTLHFRDYGSYIEDLKAGRTVVFADARLDPRTKATAAALEAISARAVLNMPVTERGGLVALLYLNHAEVREWPDEELAFVREMAERTRTAVARLTAERELRASEARYRTLFEAIDVGFCVVEMKFDDNKQAIDYRLAEINPAFERQTGLRGAAGQWVSEAAPGLERHWFDTYGRVALTGEPVRFENRAEPFGRWYDVHAFRAGEPQEHRVAILFNDITERRDAEDRLRELNETLEQQVAERTADRDRLWRSSQDMLLIARFDGTIVAANPAWTAILGWSEAELVGANFMELIHPDDLASSQAEAARLAAEGRTNMRFENRYRAKDGKWVWLSWAVSSSAGLYHAVARDVTAVKARQAELEAAQEALRQSQKMEAVGQLTGGIAHDFNNMLAVVIGSLDLLGRRIGAGDARAKRYVDAASEGARRAATLTQRLLAFSRQQPLKPEAVDANKLVAGMSELIRGSLGSDIRLETVLSSGLWRTHADPNQLESVLLNLAVNARDAMPDGGRLTIETANGHLDARYVAAHLGVPAGQYVMIAVTDTGTGMPPEVIAKAFDPFFTTKAVGKGTGLGLSQVYGFVKQSGGHVKIYSEPGQGTTVKVYLPRLVRAEGEALAEESVSDVPLGEREEVVLVVEDEPAVRQFSVDALTELGYRVLEADGAASALRLLDGHGEIALLFTDVVMPDVNGAKLAEEARRRRPDLKVLFTTGYTRNAVVHNGVLDPGVELIGKPFTLEELAAKVRQVLDAPTRAG